MDQLTIYMHSQFVEGGGGKWWEVLVEQGYVVLLFRFGKLKEIER